MARASIVKMNPVRSKPRRYVGAAPPMAGTSNGMNPKIFKAYDIRGRYPEEIDVETVYEIAAALAKIFRSGTVVLGYDARFGSRELCRSAGAGLKKTNPKLKVIDAGLMTTPMLYFLVNSLRASGGLMITASHSPKEINGLKAVRSKAIPISGQDILKLLR